MILDSYVDKIRAARVYDFAFETPPNKAEKSSRRLSAAVFLNR